MADNKIIKGRFGHLYDTHANWVKNNPVLRRGEIAIAIVETLTDAAKKDGVLKVPAVIIKAGNATGTGTFTSLPTISALAADVIETCKTEAALENKINALIAAAGHATESALSELSDKVDENTEDLAILNGTGEGSVAKQIADAIAATNYDNKYDAKGAAAQALADAKTYADGKDGAIAAAQKAGDDAQAAADAAQEAADNANDAIEVLNGTGEGSVDKKVADAIAGVVASAPADFDTLKEIADYIASDKTGAAELNNKVDANEKAIDAVEEDVADLQNDAHTHTNKATLDKVTEDHLAAIGTAVQNVTVGEGLKVTREGNDINVDIDPEYTFIIDCGTSADII